MGRTKLSVKKYLTFQPTKPCYRTKNTSVVVRGVFDMISPPAGEEQPLSWSVMEVPL